MQPAASRDTLPQPVEDPNHHASFDQDREAVMRPSRLRLLPLLSALGILVSAAVVCGDDAGEQTLLVTATAYNSLARQTDLEPDVAAWGDALEPGMKIIAVSRDLLAMGLERESPLSIDGLKGEYRVLDKMHTRWEKRIDIYMGEDVEAARAWGARLVRIRW